MSPDDFIYHRQLKSFPNEFNIYKLTEWMVQCFKDRNIPIAGVYYCHHHPEKGIGTYRTKCPCRKPAPGMVLNAQRDHNVDLSRSILIGDKESDIEAGKNAGVGYNILVESRYTDQTEKSTANLIAKNLKNAIDLLKLMNI